MGYFGHSGFENDEALDWLDAVRQTIRKPTIKKALVSYTKFVAAGMRGEKRLSEGQIENVVTKLIELRRQEPHMYPEYVESGLPLDAWLRVQEAEEREFYYSGRYLDEEYGPVEPAFAAAELVATWAGYPPDEMPEEVEAAIARARKHMVPPDLLDLAIESVDGILANERYRNMRRYYLSAFQDFSGGDDEMKGVLSLRARLQKAKAASA